MWKNKKKIVKTGKTRGSSAEVESGHHLTWAGKELCHGKLGPMKRDAQLSKGRIKRGPLYMYCMSGVIVCTYMYSKWMSFLRLKQRK